MDEWLDGWMDGWKDGCIERKIMKIFYSHNKFVLILLYSQNIFSQRSHSKFEMVGSKFESRQVLEIFLFFKMSRVALKPTQPPIQLYRGSFPGGRKTGRNVMSTTHLHLAPRLRMNGVIPLLPLYVFKA